MCAFKIMKQFIDIALVVFHSECAIPLLGLRKYDLMQVNVPVPVPVNFLACPPLTGEISASRMVCFGSLWIAAFLSHPEILEIARNVLSVIP
jgi:hypothetical protein